MTEYTATTLKPFLRTWQYPQAGSWHAEVYQQRSVVKTVPQTTTFKFQTLVEQCPPLKDDTATIGTFTYYQGTHVTLPAKASNYQVQLVVKNPTAQAQTSTVIVNALETTTLTIAADQQVTVKFAVALTQAQFDLTFTNATVPSQVGELMVLNVRLQPVQLTAAATPRLFVASDSTAQTYTQAEFPQTGWGAVLYTALFPNGQATVLSDPHADYSLARRYQQGKYQIFNKSIGGRSARSFIEEGKLASLAAEIRPHDYLLIQWGDNDATSYRPMRYVAPTDFASYLNQYIDSALTRQAQPILVTPPSQCKFDGQQGHIGFQPYRAVMLELAQKRHLPVIDLGRLSADALTKLGPHAAKALYLQFAPGQYPAFPEGIHDQTHFNRFGAKVLARLVASELARYQSTYVQSVSQPVQPLVAPAELSAEVEANERVRLRWAPVASAEFYQVVRRVANQESTYFTALEPTFIDVDPGAQPTYQVFAGTLQGLGPVSEIQVPLASNQVRSAAITGLNVYEIDTQTLQDQISFSLRFTAHEQVATYWVYLTNQQTHERRRLGSIAAKDVYQLHSYQAPKAGVWLVQVVGQDTQTNQRLKSKSLIIKALS